MSGLTLLCAFCLIVAILALFGLSEGELLALSLVKKCLVIYCEKLFNLSRRAGGIRPLLR